MPRGTSNKKLEVIDSPTVIKGKKVESDEKDDSEGEEEEDEEEGSEEDEHEPNDHEVDGEGFISIWCGKFHENDEEAFYEYLQEDYPEDEDGMTSAFMKDAGISFYDEDFREGIFSDSGKITTLKSMLQRLSYNDSFIEAALVAAKTKKISKVNCILGIFDLKHEEEMLSEVKGLHFLGYFPYEKN